MSNCLKSTRIHDGRLPVIHAQKQTFVWYLFPVHIQRKITEIVGAEKYGFVVTEPRKSAFITMVNRRRLGMGLKTALSKDSD